MQLFVSYFHLTPAAIQTSCPGDHMMLDGCSVPNQKRCALISPYSKARQWKTRPRSQAAQWKPKRVNYRPRKLAYHRKEITTMGTKPRKEMGSARHVIDVQSRRFSFPGRMVHIQIPLPVLVSFIFFGPIRTVNSAIVVYPGNV